jgi:hypothetical protein
MTFDPLSPSPAPAAATARHDAPDWRAVLAALRPVRASLHAIAERELRGPSWRPGGSIEDAAHAEGRKDLWREILSALEETA